MARQRFRRRSARACPRAAAGLEVGARRPPRSPRRSAALALAVGASWSRCSPQRVSARRLCRRSRSSARSTLRRRVRDPRLPLLSRSRAHAARIGDDVVVSPADGEVIYVRHSEGGRLPVVDQERARPTSSSSSPRRRCASDDAVVVGIAMSFLDVHVNRAPIAGQVRLREHFPGRFGSLGRPEMVFENERATTVIERAGHRGRGRPDRVAARAADRLATSSVGDERGARVSASASSGSGRRSTSCCPSRATCSVTVRPGQRVRAGESVLALVEPARSPP